MIIRTHSVKLVLLCLATILGLQSVFAAPAHGADDKSPKHSFMLLDDARRVIAKNSDKFIVQHKSEALLAKLSILESQSDVKTALDRARSIKSPFYSSLALCGIAATEIPSDLSASTKHFKEALTLSGNVKHWTGSHATSLGFLFELLPSYPEKQSHELLKVSKEAFHSWEGSDYQRSKALLSLSKATTAIGPEATKDLLYDVALKSNHYWDSIEYLATFMAQQSMKEALELSEKHYTAKKDWPNDQYFRRAVLIELSKTDFPDAFEGIKNMRKLDQEIAAVKLAEFLLGKNRKKDAQQVIAHIESLKSDFNWTQSSLKTLRSRLEKGEQVATPSVAATPEAIDDLLKNPSAARLQSVSNSRRVVFRDERQIRDFIAASLPLIEGIRDMGYPHHGSPRSTPLGLLVVCSALIHEIPQALEISKRIDIPELRANYLLDAYETMNPMVPTVSQWPIHFWQHKTVLIMEEKKGPNKAIDSDKR